MAAEPQIEPVPPGIGLVAPHDFALDRELWRALPEEVSLYLTRMPRPAREGRGLERARRLGDLDQLRDACRRLVVPMPSATAYLCASCSFVSGLAGERALRTAMEEGGAIAPVTTAGALLERLAATGASRVAIATPYDETVTDRLSKFLAEAGVETTASAHLGIESEVWRLAPTTVRALVESLDLTRADAIFLSCTNLPTADLLGPLERRLGLPLLSANSVRMAAALHRLDLA
jgi:maleate isomerase